MEVSFYYFLLSGKPTSSQLENLCTTPYLSLRLLPRLPASSDPFTCVPLVRLAIRELSSPFQTQLGIDTNMRVTDAQDTDIEMTVTDVQTIVADTQVTVTKIGGAVADISRDMLVGQKATSGQTSSVGETCYL